MMEESLKVAQGISDFGFMVIVCAVFLCLAAALMVACFKWFKSIINDMIKSNQSMVAELLTETKTQNDMLTDIAEGLRPETQLRIKNISSIYFDLAVERVCRIIKKVREENHIADREATKAKVHTLIMNMHEDNHGGKGGDARCPDTAARAITRGRNPKNRPHRDRCPREI